MLPQYCKCPVDLLQQHDAREFVGKGHLAERDHFVRGVSRSIAEPVCRPYSKDQMLHICGLLCFDEPGELFGSQLLPASIEQHEYRSGAASGALKEFKKRGLSGHV